VLQQMARGGTNAAIATELHLSESSVETYATSISGKLGLSGEPGVHRRVAAVVLPAGPARPGLTPTRAGR
jgi:DNA-binding NarL/FixJ family response regulator